MRTRICVLAIALAAGLASAAPVSERITPYHGLPIDNAENVTFDGQQFTIPGHDPLPRADVQGIEFSAPGQDARAAKAMAAAASLSDLAKAQLPVAARLAKKYPGVAGVVLIDDGAFTLNKDGTNAYQYHFAGLVLKDEMKSWAQVSLGFTEGRSRARILYGRAVSKEGTVTALEPDTIKVSSPSEEMQFFSPTRKVMSGVIPGVEVGSVVEYAYEYEEYNPEDPRLFSPGFMFQGMEPLVLSRVKVTTPSDVTLNYVCRHFPNADREKPSVTEADGVKTYTWQLEAMPPISPEPLMPPEEDVVPAVECSIFKSFDDVFTLLRGLQEARIQVTPEIEAKTREIIDGAQTVDEKIARIYYWVQENTRYISIKGSLGAGFSGHTAQETFENRYGDCTDKSILFSTMLKAAGVNSYPIIIQTNDSGSAITEIPTLSGNHCISEVCLPDRDFYLDSTAQTYRYPYFRCDDHGVSALNAIRGDLKTIPVPPPSDNQRVSKLELTLAGNGDVEVRTRNEYNGTIEASIRGFWKQAREDNRNAMMTEYVNSLSPGAVLKDFTLSKLEDLNVPLVMTLDYTLPGHAIKAKRLMYFSVPTLERDFPEVALETRQYPIQYMTTEERVLDIDIALPPGLVPKWLPPPLDISNPYVSCSARYEARDKAIHYQETFRRLQRVVPVADYPAYRDALRAIAAFSKQEVFLTKKG